VEEDREEGKGQKLVWEGRQIEEEFFAELYRRRREEKKIFGK
jgi:hypothetical protein